MGFQKISAAVAGLTVSLLLSPASFAADNYPSVTEEGLEKIKDTGGTLVYAKPDVDLSVYDRVWLVDATVAFKKNWQRDQNRAQPFKVNTRDMDRIKEDLAGLFKEVFTGKLTEGGYQLATETGEDVLVVRPAIVNLDVQAPDVSSASRSYQLVESAGEMTLYVELYDSVTGDMLAKAMDRVKDRERGYFQWQSRASNRSAAKNALNMWADILVVALDEAKSATGESEKEQQ